jgi:hypothetical protein
MFQAPTFVTVQLCRGELLAWWRPRQARLRVLSGVAWVSRSNDLTDHFLPPGASLTLPRHSRVLISAENDAVLNLEFEPGRFAFARALWRPSRALRV